MGFAAAFARLVAMLAALVPPIGLALLGLGAGLGAPLLSLAAGPAGTIVARLFAAGRCGATLGRRHVGGRLLMGEWRAVNVGRRSDLLRQFEPPLHLLDVLDLAGIHERHDRAASACSGRAAGTVDVGGVLIDRVEVHHTLDCVDMNASGGDIGGDQCRCLAPGEVVEGSLSLIL